MYGQQNVKIPEFGLQTPVQHWFFVLFLSFSKKIVTCRDHYILRPLLELPHSREEGLQPFSHLCVCLVSVSVCISAAPTGRISLKFGIEDFL
jgi:hypothetical protein